MTHLDKTKLTLGFLGLLGLRKTTYKGVELSGTHPIKPRFVWDKGH